MRSQKKVDERNPAEQRRRQSDLRRRIAPVAGRPCLFVGDSVLLRFLAVFVLVDVTVTDAHGPEHDSKHWDANRCAVSGEERRAGVRGK